MSYSDKNLDGAINPNDEIIEESNYYPFGLQHKGYNIDVTGGNSLAQSFKYNGIEFNESLGLNLYEMDLRMYDPAIGRFNGIDPVIHHSQGTSVAFDNNPIFFADPSGADAESDEFYASKGGRSGSLGPGDNSPVDSAEVTKRDQVSTISNYVKQGLSSSGPDSSKLHIFNSSEEGEAYDFINSNSRENGKFAQEVSGLITESNVYVQSWDNNSTEGAVNFGDGLSAATNPERTKEKLLSLNGVVVGRLIAQIHTHKDGGRTGQKEDLLFSRNNRIPVYVINNYNSEITFGYDFRAFKSFLPSMKKHKRQYVRLKRDNLNVTVGTVKNGNFSIIQHAKKFLKDSGL